MGAIYTKEMDDYIKQNFRNSIEFMIEFNKRFMAGRTLNALEQRARLLGLTKIKKANEETRPLNIAEVKRRAIGKRINGYKLINFFDKYALYEKTFASGDTVRTTYSYFDLNNIV